MALTRCTCVYRISTLAERDDGQAEITVAMTDPWCPATELHERTRQPAKVTR